MIINCTETTQKQYGVYGVWSAHADTGPYVSGSFRRVCGLGGRRRRELSVTPPHTSPHRHNPVPTPPTRRTPPEDHGGGSPAHPTTSTRALVKKRGKKKEREKKNRRRR